MSDGKIVYTPAANYNGSDSLKYKLTDSVGHSGTATVSITVKSVNDAPTISDVANQSTRRNTATGAIGVTIGDVDAGAVLTLTASSSNTTVVPKANIALGGSGASRTVTITPAADQSGTSTITLAVSDGNGGTATDTFVLTVNDPPTISDVGNQTSNEDAATAALPFTVADTEAAPGSLTVAASSSNTTLVPNANANIVLGGSGGARTVALTPAPDQSPAPSQSRTAEARTG